MRGEPIESVKVGLADMIASLRLDPYALETVWVSIITYDREVKQLLPLTELENLRLPDVVVPESGPTFMGAALKMLCTCYDREVNTGSALQKGDWMPLLFVLTDGKPSDLLVYEEAVLEVKRRHFTNIVACAAGPKARTEPLKKLTDDVYSLDMMDGTSFRRFFQWMTINVQQGGRSVGLAEKNELPPPPPEVNLVS